MKAQRSIFIDVREWRDKTYGNTYYSAVVSVDGEWVFTTGMNYGYGEQSVYEVAKTLRELGYINGIDTHYSLMREMREAGIDLYVSKSDVNKRELPKAAVREGVTA